MEKCFQVPVFSLQQTHMETREISQVYSVISVGKK